MAERLSAQQGQAARARLASALLLAGAALAVLGNALHPILSEPGEV